MKQKERKKKRKKKKEKMNPKKCQNCGFLGRLHKIKHTFVRHCPVRMHHSKYKEMEGKGRGEKKKDLKDFVSDGRKNTLVIVDTIVLPDLREMLFIRPVQKTECDFHHLHV